MNGDHNMQVTKEIVSVSEMARMLGFSRARIYQLIHDGVLPKPTKMAEGGRPFFTREQQAQCLTVRRTNCGIDGRPILFYSMRMPSAPPTTPARQPRQRPSSQRSRQTGGDATISALRQGLTQLGMVQVSDASIRTALTETYSDGWSNVDQPELLRSIFVHLNRQDSPDNVTR